MVKNMVSYRAEAWDILQHLFKEKRINDRTIHFTATFSGNLNLECLKRSVDLIADAFPLIRCGFDTSGSRARWVEKGYTSKDMVELRVTGNVDEAKKECLCREADEKNGPQLKIWVIRSGKTDTLCAAINHMLCDGAGFKDFLYLLASIYTGVERNPDYRPESAMGYRDIGQVMKTFSFPDKVKIFVRHNDMTKHDTAKFDLEGDLGNPFVEIKTVPRNDFRRLKAYAKGHGATVNDVLLAAYIRTLTKHFGRCVAVPCAVDLRKYLPNRRADGFCNLVTNLACDIGPGMGSTFEITLNKVKQQMTRQKDDIRCMKSMALLEGNFRLLPYRIAKKLIDGHFSNPLVALSNIGVLDRKKLQFGKTGMTSAFITGSIKYAPYVMLSVSSYNDEATLSINLYGTPGDRKTIAGLLNGMTAELTENLK